MPCFVTTKRYATIMAVMARESWTDERLDDLKGQMNERFDRVDREMNQRFDQVDKQMNERFGRVEGDVKALRSEMTQNFRTTCTILIGGFAAIVAAVIGASAL